jgi:hypothetical protein
MKLLVLLAACGLMSLSAVAQQSSTSHVNGTWKFDLALGDNPLPETCILHDDSPKLTGVCKMPVGEADIVGEINGNDVQWKHMADVFGNSVAFSFTGKVKDDGTMSGTFGIDAFGVSAPFTATKTTAAK